MTLPLGRWRNGGSTINSINRELRGLNVPGFNNGAKRIAESNCVAPLW
jgi:hypothetical protein